GLEEQFAGLEADGIQRVHGKLGESARSIELTPAHRIREAKSPRLAGPRIEILESRDDSFDPIPDERVVSGEILPRHAGSNANCRPGHLTIEGDLAQKSRRGGRKATLRSMHDAHGIFDRNKLRAG